MGYNSQSVMKKEFGTFCMILLLGSLLLCSCKSNDPFGSLSTDNIDGWYIQNIDKVAKASDFVTINEAINNHELLSEYRYGGTVHKYYATYDFFFDEKGWWTDSDAHYGRLRFAINNYTNIIHISGSTIEYYGCALGKSGYSSINGCIPLYDIYAGPIFNTLTFYGNRMWTLKYTIVDNTIVTSNYEHMFTIQDNEHLDEITESNSRWTKYK